MIDISKYENPLQEAVYFISSMFHSLPFENRPESQWVCPHCYLKDESVNDHLLLAQHIRDKHPEQFHKYSDDIDSMLKNPIGSIEISMKWFESLVKDYILSEQHKNDCTLCGFTPKFIGKAELREHFETKHRQELEEIWNALKSEEK